MGKHHNIDDDVLGVHYQGTEYAEYADTRELVHKDNTPLPFPTAAMPKAVRPLITEGAASIGCPEDFLGASVLATLSAAIGASRVLEIKGGWTEGAALYVCIVADPGDKKSPAQALGTFPAADKQTTLAAEFEERMLSYDAEVRQHKVDAKSALKDAVIPPPEPEAPTLERTVIGDATTEAIARILQENPRGVLSNRDELAAWYRGLDQYRAGGKGNDRQFWLSVWSNSPVQFDRKGAQQPTILARPFLTLLGSIQPDVLRQEFTGGPDDGLRDRFLFCYPPTRITGWTEDDVSSIARCRFLSLYHRLLKLQGGTGPSGVSELSKVSFSPDGKAAFIEAFNQNSNERTSPGFPSELRGAWSKLEAYIARLALILAACRWATDEDVPEAVTGEDVRGAVELVAYFKSHLLQVHARLLGQRPDDMLLADVLGFLQAEGGSFQGTPTDLYKAVRSPVKPERTEDFTRKLREFSDQRRGVNVTDKTETLDSPTTKSGRTTRRVIRVELSDHQREAFNTSAYLGADAQKLQKQRIQRIQDK